MSQPQPTDGQGPPRETSPWTRPWFIASAAVIVLIAALGIAYAMIPSGGQSNAAATPTGTTTATATGTAGAGQDSVCGLPAGDQRYPSVGLPTKWELLGRVAVPTDPKGVGPGKVDGNVRTCYQHSPTGALYAAANIVAVAYLPGGEAIAVKDLSADGSRRSKFLATPAPASTPDATAGVQIGGFKVQSYTADAATIVLALKTSTGGFGSMTLPLKWDDGDWKLDYDAMGNVSVVSDLSSFVPWLGV